MTRIYVSGPISGRDLTEAEAHFADAAAALAAKGWEVVNPMALPAHAHHDGSYANYMRHDLRALLDCDAIYMLQGWTTSRGAMCEKHVAEMLELPVWFENRGVKAYPQPIPVQS